MSLGLRTSGWNVSPLFDKSDGYRKLTSFTFATIVHLDTIRFCKRFIPFKEDPLGKTAGQMIGAARSGRQNIIEGSERSGTSKETEMKLADVARASLAELLGDYEIFLAERGALPWSIRSAEYQTVSALNPAPFEFSEDVLHDYWRHFHREKKAFEPWVENADGVIAANSLIVVIRRTMALLGSQFQHQGTTFLGAAAPECPECGKPMQRRKARSGKNAGHEFWGCTGYPGCKGTRKAQVPDPAATLRPES